jgi:hypothetical protein
MMACEAIDRSPCRSIGSRQAPVIVARGAWFNKPEWNVFGDACFVQP